MDASGLVMLADELMRLTSSWIELAKRLALNRAPLSHPTKATFAGSKANLHIQVLLYADLLASK